jgi:membrane associated rhomboid family serine protease
MLPIRDDITSKNVPVVNHLLIGINVLVFLVQLAQGSGPHPFATVYGLVPARFVAPYGSADIGFWQYTPTLVTFMFLHGGFSHIIGNMLFLHIFGDNVEDRLGPLRYLFFYLAVGIVSGLTQMVINIHSQIPIIGASGAVSGVMGAYVILHPGAKILTLVPIIIIPWMVDIPAIFFVGIWFIFQFINAAGSSGAATGVAWWAHIGGFLFGMVLLKVSLRVPESGLSKPIRSATVRKKSHRLQVIRPDAPRETDPNLYGTLHLTPFEALTGARKMVTVSRGLKSRQLRVTVPAGMKSGSSLRLRGEGKTLPDGTRGDLYLKIEWDRW